MMRLPWFICLVLGASVLPAAEMAAPEPKVTWAVKEGAWDGWKPDVVKMRAARPIQPLAGMVFSQRVEWKAYHDINASCLADGRVLNLELKRDEWKKLDAWPKGKELFLCYDEARGASLYDPESKAHFLLRTARNKAGAFCHPIDDYLPSLEAISTYDMMSVGHEGVHLWQAEIDRCVKSVLAKKHLPEKVRREFIELTATRIRFCEQQIAFGAAAIRADITGTAAGPMVGNYAADIYRQAYFALAQLSDSYDAFDSPPEK